MKPEYAARYEKMGLLISIYRRKLKMTQAQLGEILNVDAQHISRIERATNGISLDVLFAIADALSIEPKRLLDFEKVDGLA